MTNAMGRALATAIAAVAIVTTASMGGGVAVAAPTPGVHPGSAIVINTKRCTLGFVVGDRNGEAVGLTAGHCGSVGDEVRDKATGRRLGKIIKQVSDPTTAFQDDLALIQFGGGGSTQDMVPTPEGNKRLLGNMPIEVVDATLPMVCKVGSTTGITCGRTIHSEVTGSVDAEMVSDRGDSGSPVYAVTPEGVWAVGILTGSPQGRPANTLASPVGWWIPRWGLDVRGT